MSNEIAQALADEKEAALQQLLSRDHYIDYLLGKLLPDETVLSYDDWYEARPLFKVGDRVSVPGEYGETVFTVAKVLPRSVVVHGIHYFLEGVADNFFFERDLKLI